MDIEKVRTFYERLEPVVEKLKKQDMLDQPVREDAWTPRQFLHHLADAQTQAFYRILWIITEDHTVIKPFDQDDWVRITGDYPVEAAMAQLKGVYLRWYHLLNGLDETQWQKTGHHPELGQVTIKPLVEYYIEHGETHVSQFASLVEM